MTNLTLFPIEHWPGACPVAFAAELVDIAETTRSLDARVIRLAERQRTLKARLAATRLPEALQSDALSAWTWRVFEAEGRIMQERKAL